jgi:predicted nucleotidyltransferase
MASPGRPGSGGVPELRARRHAGRRPRTLRRTGWCPLAYYDCFVHVTDAVSLRDRLREVLSNGPPLRLAVMFGSLARGQGRQDSDVDVGIIPVDPDLPLHDELCLASALSNAAGRDVDLVRLDVDDALLGAEVARDGICLLEACPGTFAAYRADAMSRWMDWEETIAPHRAHMLRRLAGGGA